MTLLNGSLAFPCERKAIFVVLGFPPSDLSTEISLVLERPASVELLCIGFVAAFDFAVDLGAPRRDLAMGDFRVREIPGELWTKPGVIVDVIFLDRKGKVHEDFPEEVHCCLAVVVVVDA